MIRFMVGLLILIFMLFLPLPIPLRISLLIFGAVLALDGGLILMRGGVMLEELYADPFWKHFFGVKAERRAFGGSFVLGGLMTLFVNPLIALIALVFGAAVIAVEFFYDIDAVLEPPLKGIGSTLEAQINKILR